MPFWKSISGGGRASPSGHVNNSYESLDEYRPESSPTFYDAKENPSLTDNTALVTPTRIRGNARRYSPDNDLKKSTGGYFEHRLLVTGNNTVQSNPASPSQESPRQDVQAAIAMLQDLKKTATADDLVALKEALSGFGIADEGETTPKCRASEKTVVENPLIRCRSLFTSPGVATRKVTPKVLKKPPPETKAKGQYQRSDLEKASALDQIIQDSGAGVVNRPSTPSAFEYPLGGYELGTLRITNGAASPQPSLLSSKWPRPTSVQVTEYYTASEGAGSATEPDDSQQTSQVSSVHDDELREDKDAAAKSSPIIVDSAPTSQLNITRTRSRPRSPGSPIGPRRMPLTRRHTDESGLSDISAIVHPAGFTSLYQSEALSNPFLPGTVDTQPELSDSHLRSAAEKGLMRLRDEMRTPALPDDVESIYSDHHKVPSILRMPSCKDEALQRLNGNSYGRISKRTVSDSSSVYPNQPTARRSLREAGISRADTLQYGRAPNIDSGYSSANSSHQFPENVGAYSRERQDAIPHPIPFTHATRQTNRDNTHGYTVPRNAITQQPLSNERQMYSLPYKSASAGDIHQTTATTGPISSPVVLEKSENKKQGPNKLQKKRPFAGRGKSAPIVTAASSPSTVPQVPGHLTSMHQTRMDKNPGMDSLKHTFDSVSSCEPKVKPVAPTLPSVEIRFPSPTPGDETRASEKRGRRSSWKPNSGSTQPHHRFFRSRSRKEEESRQINDVGADYDLDGYAGVHDFGTVAESLGSSPYDITYSPQRHHQPHADPNRISHPHQMVRNPLRRKPMWTDDKAASRFAMHRSRDRLANFDGERPRADMQEGMGVGNRRPRPMTMYADVPPVPALPSEKARHAARPQSYHSATETQGAIYARDEEDDNTAVADDVDESSVWASHSKRWRRRRKSAGERLQTNEEYQQVQSMLRNRSGSQLAEARERPQLRLTADIPTPTISLSPISPGASKSHSKQIPSDMGTTPEFVKSTPTVSNRKVTPPHVRKPLPPNARVSSPTPSNSSVLAKAAMFQAMENERPSRPPSPEKNEAEDRDRMREWMWSRTQVWSSPVAAAGGIE